MRCWLLALLAGFMPAAGLAQQLFGLPVLDDDEGIPVAGVFMPVGDGLSPLVSWLLWSDGRFLWKVSDHGEPLLYCEAELDPEAMDRLLAVVPGDMERLPPSDLPARVEPLHLERHEFFVRRDSRIWRQFLSPQPRPQHPNLESREGVLRELSFKALELAPNLQKAGRARFREDLLFDYVLVAPDTESRRSLPIPPTDRHSTWARPYLLDTTGAVPLLAGAEPLLYRATLRKDSRVLNWAVWDDGTVVWNEWNLAPFSDATRTGKVPVGELHLWLDGLSREELIASIVRDTCAVELDVLLGHGEIRMRATTGTLVLESSHPVIEFNGESFKPAFGPWREVRGRSLDRLLEFEPQCYRRMREAWSLLTDEFDRFRRTHAGAGTVLTELPWRWSDQPPAP